MALLHDIEEDNRNRIVKRFDIHQIKIFCPKCKSQLIDNSMYEYYFCKNDNFKVTYEFIEARREANIFGKIRMSWICHKTT